MYVCTYVCIYVCMYVRMRVCVCMYGADLVGMVGLNCLQVSKSDMRDCSV